MKKYMIVFFALLILTVSAGAWADTSGLTGINWSWGGTDNLTATFVVWNLTTPSLNPVFVDELRVVPEGANLDPSGATSSIPSAGTTHQELVEAASWTWQDNKFTKVYDESTLKWNSPPSLAPGDYKTFSLTFSDAEKQNLPAWDFRVHVLQVTWDGSTSTYGRTDNTWFDVPTPVDDHGDPIGVVPEASSLMLGAMGLLGPAGLVFSRRRRS